MTQVTNMETMFLEGLPGAVAWIPTERDRRFFIPKKRPLRFVRRANRPPHLRSLLRPTHLCSVRNDNSIQVKLLKFHFFMQNQVKVLRAAFQRISQTQLTVYVDNVVKRTLNQPNYAAVQTQVTALADDLQAYNNALTAALRGGVSDTVNKDLAKAKLLSSLDALCTAIEQQPLADMAFIAGAGLSTRNSRQGDSGEIAPPRSIQVKSTGFRGQVQVTISDPKAAGTLNYAVEYSADNGATWTNGTYSSRRSFTVNNLPAGRDLKIRIRVLGTKARHSAWSESLTAAVA